MIDCVTRSNSDSFPEAASLQPGIRIELGRIPAYREGSPGFGI